MEVELVYQVYYGEPYSDHGELVAQFQQEAHAIAFCEYARAIPLTIHHLFENLDRQVHQQPLRQLEIFGLVLWKTGHRI